MKPVDEPTIKNIYNRRKTDPAVAFPKPPQLNTPRNSYFSSSETSRPKVLHVPSLSSFLAAGGPFLEPGVGRSMSTDDKEVIQNPAADKIGQQLSVSSTESKQMSNAVPFVLLAVVFVVAAFAALNVWTSSSASAEVSDRARALALQRQDGYEAGPIEADGTPIKREPNSNSKNKKPQNHHQH